MKNIAKHLQNWSKELSIQYENTLNWNRHKVVHGTGMRLLTLFG